MSRQEFIDELRTALQGQVDQNTINNNISYYENYIMQETRKGLSEEEVLQQLGSPRLLAKTIINSGKGQHGNREYQNGYERYAGTDHSSADYDSENDVRINGKVYHGLKAKLLVWTAILAIILIVFGVIALIAGVISVLAPILIPLLLIVLGVRLISRQR